MRRQWRFSRSSLFWNARKYGVQDSKPMSTSADPNVRLKKDNSVCKAVNSVLYQSMVGSLLYAGISTRPNVSHTVGAFSKFRSYPSKVPLIAIKWIFATWKVPQMLAWSIRYPKAHSLLDILMQTTLVIWMTGILQVAIYLSCAVEQWTGLVISIQL